MTEDEAKKRWCPFARLSYHAPPTPAQPAEDGFIGNRDINDGLLPNSYCIASECMAWRWETRADGAALYAPRSDRPVENSRLGYCGLAGKP